MSPVLLNPPLAITKYQLAMSLAALWEMTAFIRCNSFALVIEAAQARREQQVRRVLLAPLGLKVARDRKEQQGHKGLPAPLACRVLLARKVPLAALVVLLVLPVRKGPLVVLVAPLARKGLQESPVQPDRLARRGLPGRRVHLARPARQVPKAPLAFKAQLAPSA